MDVSSEKGCPNTSTLLSSWPGYRRRLNHSNKRVWDAIGYSYCDYQGYTNTFSQKSSRVVEVAGFEWIGIRL